MDMKKAFVGVGIGVMVVTGLIQSGVIDVNEKLGQPSISSTPTASDNTVQTVQSQTKKVVTQPTINESKWEKIATKTCIFGWENQDFHEGWCDLGKFNAGEYRVVLKAKHGKNTVANWQNSFYPNGWI